MGIFDPVVDTEVNIPNVQATPAMPSAVGGFAQIFGGLVDTYGAAQRAAGSGGPSATELREEEDRLRTVGLTDALLENSVLWDENPSQARIRENQILLNYTRDGGDPSGEDFRNTYRLATGRNPEHIGMSATEVVLEAVQETEEFRSAYMASYSALEDGTSEEDRQAYALGRVATFEAYSQLLQDRTVGWGEQELALSGMIDGFLAEGLGTMIASGDNISEEGIQNMRMQFEVFRSEIGRFRREGISDTQWSSIEGQLTGLENVLSIMESTAGLEGVNMRARDAIARIIADTDIPPGRALQLTAILEDPVAAMNAGALEVTEWSDLIHATTTAEDPGADGITPDMTASGFLSDPSFNPGGSVFPQAVLDALPEDLGAPELFAESRQGLGFVGAQTAAAYNNEATRDRIGRVLMRNFAAMNRAGEMDGFATARGLTRSMGGATITAIDRIAQHDPEAARMLYMQGATAIRTQGSAANATFQTMLSRNPDVIHEDGQIIITEDWLVENAGISRDAAAAGQRAANEQGISLTEWARRRTTAGSSTGRLWQQIDELQAQGEIVRAYAELDSVYSGRLENGATEANELREQQEGLLGTYNAGGTYRPVHTIQEMRLAIGSDAVNLNPAFADGLTALLNAARDEGITVGINNSYRSPETQAQLISNYWGNYDLNPADRVRWLADVEAYGPVEAGNRWEATFTAARRNSDGSPMRNWIGLPGRSNHQHGLAADLTYGDQNAIDWVHNNASRFGLHFPLSNENWHVEVMGSRDGTVGSHQIGSSTASERAMEQQFRELLSNQPTELRDAFDGLLRGTGSVPAGEAVAANNSSIPTPEDLLASDESSSVEVEQLAEATAAAQERDQDERTVAAQQEAQALTASEVLDDDMMRRLRELGGTELTPAFTSIEEASDAIRNGTLTDGMAYVLNGQVRVYEEPE